MRPRLLPRVAWFVLVQVGLCSLWAAPRPNIVLIMSDDMGYSDIGCYGGEIETPALDRLASGGLRFTQFYNTGRCCPTRASLLTGLYPHQAGIGHMTYDGGREGYRGQLNRRCRTIAEVLRPAGYRTYMAGKWHVTRDVGPDGPKDVWPLQRGFDRFYGTITGAGSFFDPGTLTRDNTAISPFADPEYEPDVYYYTDAISDHAVRYVDEHARDHGERPFFLYVSYTAAHWPMHALEEDIRKFEGRYDAGYEPVRRARLEKARELGLIEASWTLTPQAGDWEKMPHKAWEARCMEVYAAMVHSMDRGIGQVIGALERHGQLANTLVFFLQDNGGCAEGVGRSGSMTRPVEPTLEPIPMDAVRQDVIPRQNRAGVPTLTGPNIMPGPEDTYIAYGRGWANVSNTPFREYKHWVHEGGIATPLIVHWPAGIDARGELRHEPSHLIDIMATCVDVSGAAYPEEIDGNDILPLEGASLTPVFAGNTLERSALFWEHEGNRAMRDGRWKLVAKGPRGPWELYDMAEDRTEMHDLAKDAPERLQAMVQAWEAWARRARVIPWIWDPPYGVQNFFQTAHRFRLASRTSLDRREAPHVEGKAFTVEASLVPPFGEGVVLAQGGSSDGYALYLKDGKPHFALRRRGRLTVVSGAEPLPEEAVTLVARVRRNGEILLSTGTRTVGRKKAAGPLDRMPIEGLQVGRDTGGAVGEYQPPYAYEGRIGSVKITLSRE